jgi:hypothetical protein
MLYLCKTAGQGDIGEDASWKSAHRNLPYGNASGARFWYPICQAAVRSLDMRAQVCRMQQKILEIGLWPYVGMGSQPLLRAQLRASGAARGILASQGLLYDTIVIPTLDFSVIPTLYDWLSLPVLRTAIENGSLCFMRYPGFIVYGGNGAGIIANVKFGKGTSNVWDWTHVSTFGSMPEALEAQVQYGSDNIPNSEKYALRDAILSASVEFDASDSFTNRIRKDTYD